MAFFIRKPTGLSGMSGGYPAGYDDGPAPLSRPFNRLTADISLIRKDQSARQTGRPRHLPVKQNPLGRSPYGGGEASDRSSPAQAQYPALPDYFL